MISERLGIVLFEQDENAMIEPEERPAIYVVRDGETVFYVGQTNDWICNRLWRHINYRSTLGRFIIANKPESFGWAVEMYTWTELVPDGYEPDIDRAKHFVTKAEYRMIRELAPCLNRNVDGERSHIPAKYKLVTDDWDAVETALKKYTREP